ncbi:hypothetical protein D3C72_1560000 [compost metagenome]
MAPIFTLSRPTSRPTTRPAPRYTKSVLALGTITSPTRDATRFTSCSAPKIDTRSPTCTTVSGFIGSTWPMRLSCTTKMPWRTPPAVAWRIWSTVLPPKSLLVSTISRLFSVSSMPSTASTSLPSSGALATTASRRPTVST